MNNAGNFESNFYFHLINIFTNYFRRVLLITCLLIGVYRRCIIYQQYTFFFKKNYLKKNNSDQQELFDRLAALGIMGTSWNPPYITALYRINVFKWMSSNGPTLCREAPASQAANVNFSSIMNLFLICTYITSEWIKTSKFD